MKGHATAPLVTVVISSYNHGPYIEDSIRSVLTQTYPFIELLVIDDGSSDDSVTRIRALQAEYGFDFREQQNQGLTRTLNDALARAKGCYFAPFGSDDIMLPERIALQVEYMEGKPSVGICAGNIELMAADGRSYPASRQQLDVPFRRLDFDDLFLGRKPYTPAPTLLFRTGVLREVGGFDPEIRLEDVYIKLKITHAGYFIDALGVPLARYRKHETNTYKNLGFMTSSVLKIYEAYSAHPLYEEVRSDFINSMFLKSANRDRSLAWKLLKQLPLRRWNGKTVRGIIRLVLPKGRR